MANSAEDDSLREVTNLVAGIMPAELPDITTDYRKYKRGADGKATEASGDALSAICYIAGRNYVGGIVGYNDVDALVEDTSWPADM